MTDLIPSKYYANYIDSINWQFSDRDKAALALHWGRSFENELTALKELKSELTDANIIAEIDDYVSRQRTKLEEFSASGDNFVFSLNHYDEHDRCHHTDGFFADFEDACKRGKKLNFEFEVTKFLVVPKGGSFPRFVNGGVNPYILDDLEEKTAEDLVHFSDEEDNGEIGSASFAADGTLTYLWLARMDIPTKSELLKEHDPDHFHNAFVKMPSPYDTGDIVKLVSTELRQGGRCGVVSTSKEEWTNYLEQIENVSSADSFDSGITVFMVDEDGNVRHEHIPPAYMEPYAPAQDDPDRDLLKSLSAVAKDSGALHWFLFNYERRRHNTGE